MVTLDMDSPAEYVAELQAELRFEKAKTARVEADLRGAQTRASKLEEELKAKEAELARVDELRIGLFDAGIGTAQVAHAALDRATKYKAVADAAESYYDEPSEKNRHALDRAIRDYRAKGKAS